MKQNVADFQTTIDCYELIECIGKGSFGRVHLAVQMLTQKHVAIKTIDKTSVALNDRAKKKIENEIEILRIASASRHMVRLLEVFENENYVFFVMEYAKKGDLLNYMKSYGVMPEFRAKNIFFDIILGLEFLHSKNVIHRDIKLDNILLSDKFRAKIADFGISKINPPENSLHEQCGTPAYLAPEIIKNNGYSGFGTDIWSLGILLHTLLLGKVPFKAETLDELYEIIVTQKLAIPEKPYITEECKDILQKMLDKNPATRISIEQIKRHPWIEHNMEEYHNPSQTESISSLTNQQQGDEFKDVEEFNQFRMMVLAYLGFKKSQISVFLDTGLTNHATACFHCLEDLMDKYKDQNSTLT